MTVSDRNIPQWLESFISTMSGNKHEVVATINLNDLPKIVWKEETFHIFFDKETNSAQILNQFSIPVVTLENVTTLEDVDKQLNGKEIVVSEEDGDTMQKESKEDILEEDILEEDNLEDTEQMEKESNLDNEFQEELTKISEELNTTDDSDVEDISQNDDLDNDEFSKLQNTVNELVKTVKTLSEQIYARQDPGDIYDTNSKELEQDHIEETKNLSEQQIEKEHNVDISTPAGRVELVNNNNDNDNNIVVVELENIDAEEISDTNVIPEIDVKNDTDELSTENIEKLSEKDSKIFKKAICINCGGEDLTKEKESNSSVEVGCGDCNTKYMVDTNTENIYKKIGGNI